MNICEVLSQIHMFLNECLAQNKFEFEFQKISLYLLRSKRIYLLDSFDSRNGIQKPSSFVAE